MPRLPFPPRLLLPILLLTAPGLHAATLRPARADCSDASASQAALRTCLQQRAAVAANELAAAGVALRGALHGWDEDARYVQAALQRADAADRAWTAYRQAACALDEALGGGAIGAALEQRRLACVQALDAQRADELRAAAASLPQRRAR